MVKRFFLSFLVITMPVVCSMAFGQAQPPDGKITVFTAIAPYAFFIEQIGGAGVKAETLVGPGKDPHSFEPTPSQISALRSAKVYFKVGMPFEEKLVEKMSSLFPNLKIVDLTSGIRLREMEAENEKFEHGGHSHKHVEKSQGHNSRKTASSSNKSHEEPADDDHDHDHGALDPHVWLSLKNVRIISSNITETLSEIVPSQAEEFKRNDQIFQGRLVELDSLIRDTLTHIKGKNIYVYHPAFGYFADDYDLKQIAVEIQGKEPTARQLARLIDSAKKKHVRVIFVAPQFSQKGAETVAKGIGGVVVEIDPLSRDYLSNMREMADRISAGIR